jgi:hypothetical protein
VQFFFFYFCKNLIPLCYGVQFIVSALIPLEYGVSTIYSIYYLLTYDICYSILWLVHHRVFPLVLIYIRMLTHSHNFIGKQLVHVNYLMFFLL